MHICKQEGREEKATTLYFPNKNRAETYWRCRWMMVRLLSNRRKEEEKTEGNDERVVVAVETIAYSGM